MCRGRVFSAWRIGRLSDGRAATRIKRESVDPKIFLYLIAATALETVGDAVVRNGLVQSAWLARSGLFLIGAVLLFGYGFCLNLAPVEFSRVVGLYIATLFVMWQITNFVFFGSLPSAPILIGGALIVAGGLIVTFWEASPN
jgi:small multidrug resistance family-3 protein